MKRKITSKMFDLKLFVSVSKEFLKALLRGHTYNIRENGYVIFGILWGIPVPIVTIGMALYCSGLSPSAETVVNEIVKHPVHLFFLLHPFIFGTVFGAMGTVRDDKERQKEKFEKSLIQNNKMLADANKKLQELDGLKDNFLSMVSHELKTPLTTIQGYITFLKDGKAGDLSEGQWRALKITEEQADYLNNLIGELVDLSRIESGEFSVKLEPTDLTRIAAKVINSLARPFAEKSIITENSLPEKLPLVLADPKRMSQVFTNLLENAVKFTPPGGKITVSACEKEEKVEFCISDTGIGIPGEEIGKIFDRFYQIDSMVERKYGGCGLGLTIIKNIIELHKEGRIWVESEPGRGSRFFFELGKSGELKGKELEKEIGYQTKERSKV
ncbi:MAG: sensor histidine kinase [Candidatus Omnitrophota bacterium]